MVIMTITFASLFSGIGGFDLGFERVDMECVLQCEIEKNSMKLLCNKWPNVEKVKDVREIKRVSADLICGGFPCQDVSVAGKRAGLAGKRSGLWYEFHRIIERNLPRWVVVENVLGLLSSNEGRDFATILRGLVSCGYGVSWRILDAQYFGLAQQRKRVFIVGSLGSGRSAQVLFESEGMSGNTPPIRETGKEVAFSLRANPSHSGDKGDGGINTTLISPTLHTGLGHHGWSIGDQDWGLLQPIGFDLAQITSKFNYSNPKAGDPQPPLNTFAQSMVANTLESHHGHNDPSNGDTLIVFDYGVQGNSRTQPVRTRGLAQVTNTQRPDAIAWQQNTRDEVRLIGGDGDIAGALSAEAGMKQKNYIGVRRLTPTECERLQGFPDGFTDGFSDSVRYRMLGNAVAVPCAEWIGRRILEAEQLRG